MLLVEIVKFAGTVRYICPNCGFVEGYVYRKTGFRKIVCNYCDFLLDDDPFGDLEYEKERSRLFSHTYRTEKESAK